MWHGGGVLFKAAIERHAKLTVACEDEDSPWHTMLHAISTMREREEDCIVIHDTSAPFFLHDSKNAFYIISPDSELTKGRLRIMTLCLLKNDDSHCEKFFDALERLCAKDNDTPLTKQDFQDALRVDAADSHKSDDSSFECSDVSHDSNKVEDSEDPPSPNPRFYPPPSVAPVTGAPSRRGRGRAPFFRSRASGPARRGPKCSIAFYLLLLCFTPPNMRE